MESSGPNSLPLSRSKTYLHSYQVLYYFFFHLKMSLPVFNKKLKATDLTNSIISLELDSEDLRGSFPWAINLDVTNQTSVLEQQLIGHIHIHQLILGQRRIPSIKVREKLIFPFLKLLVYHRRR